MSIDANIPLFELNSVGYKQQDTNILSNVSWTVEAGQHWAILGPNGSGKSTLLKVATGYLWQTSGRVLRLGEELQNLGEMRREIGWISADILNLIPAGESALETVVSGKFGQFGLRYIQATTPTQEDFQRAAYELQRIACESLANKPFGVLSQGERQQVLIARTRMAEPTLLVLDEPCAGMDPGVRERFLAWLEKQLQDPKFPTVLFATHHIEEVMPGFDHALIMVDGKLQSAGEIEQVVLQQNLETVYKTTILKIEQHGGRRWPIWGTSEQNEFN